MPRFTTKIYDFYYPDAPLFQETLACGQLFEKVMSFKAMPLLFLWFQVFEQSSGLIVHAIVEQASTCEVSTSRRNPVRTLRSGSASSIASVSSTVRPDVILPRRKSDCSARWNAFSFSRDYEHVRASSWRNSPIYDVHDIRRYSSGGPHVSIHNGLYCCMLELCIRNPT